MAAAAGSHFDLRIVHSHGVRRWLRPQANLIVNGAEPFLPLPADVSGAVFEWALNWCVSYHAHRWVAVHAAVLERGGKSIVLSGPSGSGKSTLCAALALDGWRLFSDEFALIDPDSGRLRPFPRPVSLKERSIEIIRERAPQAVFGPEGRDIEDARFVHMKPPAGSVDRARDEAAPGWVVIPRWTTGARTTLQPQSKAQTLIDLTDQSFNYNYLGARGFQAVVDLVRRSDCYKLEYSDLDDVLRLLASVTAS
jgi:hypothetical protein